MPTTEKPVWTRCPSCKQRLFNDKIDIETHRGLCPADLKRAITRLASRVEELETQVDELGRITPADGPAIDLEDVAPWPGEATDSSDDDLDTDEPEDPDDDPDEDGTFAEVTTAADYYPAIDRDDDEPAVTISPATGTALA